MSNINPILWQPSAIRQENANITRFMQWVGERYGVDVTDYAALYRWSMGAFKQTTPKSHRIFFNAAAGVALNRFRASQF
jgi:hypothetical protein